MLTRLFAKTIILMTAARLAESYRLYFQFLSMTISSIFARVAKGAAKRKGTTVTYVENVQHNYRHHNYH